MGHNSGIVASMRRSLGVFVTQEFVRHRLRRLPLVGVSRAVLDARRAWGGGMRAGMVEDRCLGMNEGAFARLRTSLPSRPPRRGWA